MTKQEMIKAIYNKIADKNLSFWCRLLTNKWIRKVVSVNNSNIINEKHYRNDKQNIIIIWHPVMIGDVFNYIEKENIQTTKLCDTYQWADILEIWKEKRKPINEQNIECIEYIYNLIK